MRLWIVRHGKADQVSPTGRDEDRELMKRGRKQAEWLGEKIASKKRRPAMILSSGLARARATAELINQHLKCELEYARELETGRAPSLVADLICRRISEGGLMVVGHNPTLGELVWILERGLPAHEAMMRTGEAAVFDFENEFGIGRGTLHKRLRLDGDD
jgi:phosphohistidine phosphatase